jgi:hypothetical protein
VFDERSYIVTADRTVTGRSRLGSVGAVRGKVMVVFRDDWATVPVIGCRTFEPIPQTTVASSAIAPQATCCPAY